MKQAALIIAFVGLIYSCTTKGKKTDRIGQHVILGSNIYSRDYDEKTGWTRILLKEPECWGYIDKDSNVVIPFIFKFLNSFDSAGMAVAQIGEKHGFIDVKGDTVIPFIYEDLSVFSEELAPAKKNGKYGYINRKGDVIIPFQFDEERHFHKTGLSEASRDGKWGFINTKGDEIVPIKYSAVNCHSMEGEFIFVCNNDKWAIFNKKGKQLSGFIYDEIYGTPGNFDYFNENYLFNGLLLVRKGNQYRYLNRKLEIIADFGYYSEAETITEHGFAIVKRGNYYGIINSQGEIVVPCTYSKIEHPPKEYQGFYDEFYIYQKGKVGLLSKYAKPLTDITYTSFDCDNCYENGNYHTLFVARKNNQCSLIGSNGEIILPLEYDSIGKFESNDCAIAKKNGRYGIINYKGDLLIPFEYSYITTYRFDENYVVEKNGKFGLINKESMKVVVPLNYEDLEVCYYDETHFIVKKNGKYGIIDNNLQIVIPLEYDKISNWVEYGPKEHFVVKNGKEGLVSREGKTVIPPVYDKIYVDNGALIKVEKNGVYGTINWKNKIVHPIQFEQILWEWPHLTGRPLDTIYVKKAGKYYATDINGKVILASVSEKLINHKFRYLNEELIMEVKCIQLSKRGGKVLNRLMDTLSHKEIDDILEENQQQPDHK
jgi:hypothetical protein